MANFKIILVRVQTRIHFLSDIVLLETFTYLTSPTRSVEIYTSHKNNNNNKMKKYYCKFNTFPYYNYNLKLDKNTIQTFISALYITLR